MDERAVLLLCYIEYLSACHRSGFSSENKPLTYPVWLRSGGASGALLEVSSVGSVCCGDPVCTRCGFNVGVFDSPDNLRKRLEQRVHTIGVEDVEANGVVDEFGPHVVGENGNVVGGCDQSIAGEGLDYVDRRCGGRSERDIAAVCYGSGQDAHASVSGEVGIRREVREHGFDRSEAAAGKDAVSEVCERGGVDSGVRGERNSDDSITGGSCVPNRSLVGHRGPNYERNRRSRDKKKQRKLNKTNDKWRSVTVEEKKKKEIAGRGENGRGGVRADKEFRSCFSELPSETRKELRESYAKRLITENRLRAVQAEQKIELEQAKDVSMLKKRQETHIMRQTEVNKVQVEKAFASLARTGNVPGVVGTVETVLSEGSSSASPVFSGVGSGTISPNSSVSLAEIRAIQKESLERAAENEKLKRRLERVLQLYPDVRGCKFLEPDAPETVNSGVTVDSNGFPIGEFGDGYDGGIREDGKWHFGQDIY